MIKTTIQVTGMMCPHCEAHVNDIIRNTFDVKKVASSRKDCQTVIVSAAALDEAALRKAIVSAGYEPGEIQTEEG